MLGYLTASRDIGPPAEQVGAWLGRDHPIYHALPRSLPIVHPPDAWYVRVPDLPTFLRQIAPVLGARLAASVASGYSGDVRLSFYRSGVVLRFAAGQLAAVDMWDMPNEREASAAFPGLSFTQLLCGYRSLGELVSAFDDCTVANEEAEVVLSALFPRADSLYWITG
jgi:hypothetical protein